MATTTTPTGELDLTRAATPSVAVVIPIPNDPDWGLFDEISQDVPIIVCDDSDGKLAPPPRDNVTYYDYAAQRDVMGAHYGAIPHKSAASRNFGHVLAYREGYDIIVALDYDCGTRPGWLAAHLAALTTVQDAPAMAGTWVNPIRQPGFYARGYPYEFRNAESAAVPALASGEVKLNVGLWDNILDLNGIDKFQAEPPYGPGIYHETIVALGNVPICGMNTAFRTEITPAYFFLPDVWIDGWHLSRHDDIWGGYIVKKLMDLRGDLLSFGQPVVEHTRQSNLERVCVMEHYMHLMAMAFFGVVDAAVERVSPAYGPDGYAEMFGAFADAFLVEVDRAALPAHYRRCFAELGGWMARWAGCFRV